MQIFVSILALLAAAGLALAQTPQISTVQNAAPLTTSSNSVARGELISIYGSHLSHVSLQSAPPTAPLTLDGTSVNIGGLPAPILFISPGQVNVQVPFDIPAGVPSLNVTVTVGTLKSPPFLIAVAMADLGLFSAQGIHGPSAANTVVVHTTPGDTLVLEATGLGAVSPAVASGAIPSGSASNALATPPVTINGAPALVLSATYAGVGLYTITVVVPASADTGSVTVVLGQSAGAIGATGPTGATGATGDIGPSGATGSEGPAGSAGEPGSAGAPGGRGSPGLAGPPGNLTPVTNYSSSTTYSQGSLVFYQGSTYQSSANGNVGHLPGSGAPWTMIAQQGTAGATGATGATGSGATGATGTTGASGAIGPTGATGSLAPVTAFDPTIPYSQGSVVFYEGSTYQSSANATAGSLPTNGAPWTLIAQEGATGAAGSNGAPGVTGPVGTAGAVGPAGAVGLPGAAGATGTTGATGATGSLAPVTAFDPTIPYVQGSVVFYEGSSYQSSANATAGSFPTNGAPWTLIAQEGATGPTGINGPTGGVGPSGAVGPAGTTGPAGVAGAPGATGATGGLAPVTTFDPTVQYSLGNVVFYLGSTYQSSTYANMGNLPGSGAPWTLIAQQGAAGPSTVNYSCKTTCTQNTLEVLVSSGTAAQSNDASVSQLTGIVGIASSNETTGLPVAVAAYGIATCQFDGNAITAGDYVQASSTSAGNCTDAGATYPTSNQIVGFALSSGAAGTAQPIFLFGIEIRGTSVGVIANNNTAVGTGALTNNPTGTQNAAIGNDALQNNTTGNLNTACGAFTLQSNSTGANNTACGANALQDNTTGFGNTAIGSQTLQLNIIGSDNTATGDYALQNNTSSGNTAMGTHALQFNTSAAGNTAFGLNTLTQTTVGMYNSALGADALYYNTTGGSNTAAGYGALQQNITGSFNTAYGERALRENTAGSYNTALGYLAGYNTAGSTNTTLGYQAGINAPPANSNSIYVGSLGTASDGTGTIQIGTQGTQTGGTFIAGISGVTAVGGEPVYVTSTGQLVTSVNTTADNNIAVGAGTLANNTSGTQNAAFGSGALQDNTIGADNTASGFYALATNTIGNYNTANGFYALMDNTAGSYNTASGMQALLKNTTGNDNTGSGFYALASNTIGTDNTAIGYTTLDKNTTGNFNIAIGSGVAVNAPPANSNSIYIGSLGTASDSSGTISIGTQGTQTGGTFIAGISGVNAAGGVPVYVTSTGQLGTGGSTANDNTALGTGTLASNTAGGIGNTAIGFEALTANNSGYGNVAIGDQALVSNTGGAYNVANGIYALQANTSGNSNTASGQAALQSNTTGNYNTAYGSGALQVNSLGSNNTATGYQALTATTGTDNTAVGFTALDMNAAGSFNIAIGSGAAVTAPTGNSNSVYIANAGAGADAPGTIKIGTLLTQTSFFVAGVFGVTTGDADAVAVFVDSNGQLGTTASSQRFKEDIQNMGNASSDLLSLRPVTFRYKQAYRDGSKPLDYGLIAEEVAAVYPDLVVRDKDGQIETVKYQKLAPMLLNELQKQASKIEQQAEQNRQLEERVTALEKLLSTAPQPVR
jgi:trimeric autotransporter adhesin